MVDIPESVETFGYVTGIVCRFDTVISVRALISVIGDGIINSDIVDIFGIGTMVTAQLS